jgi:peptide/nickel transport system substrate-binding protein
MNEIDYSSLIDKRRLHVFASIAVAMCMLFTVLATLVVTAPSIGAVQDYHEYRIGVREAPDTFNPFDMMAGTSWSIAHMMYEFLYAVGPMMEPYPQLAASHETSNENLTWTYYLVEDSYWHDGLPVTAHDVKFTFDMILDYPQECALLGDYLLGVDEVLALDNHTVQINLLTAKANMQSLIVPILPEHLWSAVRDSSEVDIDRVDMFDPVYFPDGPIGSGPFILEEYRMAEGEVHLLAQKPYHRLPEIEVDSVNIDKLLFVIYKSDPAMTTALEVGDIDVVGGVPPTVWETIIANENIDGQTPATHILEELRDLQSDGQAGVYDGHGHRVHRR